MRAASSRPEPDLATLNELYAPDHVFVPAGADMIEEEAHGMRGFLAWREETQKLLGAEHDLRGSVDVGPDKVLERHSLQREGERRRLRAAHLERGHGDWRQDHPDRGIR
jgi:ketosteroid isomerase-like protein